LANSKPVKVDAVLGFAGYRSLIFDRRPCYAERHEELWIDFTKEAVRRAGMTELVDNDGLTKHEFADELKRLE